MKTKLAATLLLLSLLCLAACGKTPQKQNDPTATTVASETAAAETVITETTTTSIYDEIADGAVDLNIYRQQAS